MNVEDKEKEKETETEKGKEKKATEVNDGMKNKR